MLPSDSPPTGLPSNSTSGVIRLIPSLSIAAIHHRLDKEISMWYCLRAINHWGSGYLDMSYAVNSLASDFYYSRSTAYRILNSGDGVFWSLQQGKGVSRLQIKISGLVRVASYLNTSCGRHFLEIPAEEFVGHKVSRLQHQKAWLYSTFHKTEGGKAHPISRASIQRATGVNRRSQQRYDKIASVRVANYADRQDANGRMVPIVEAVDGKCRQWLVHKRLGNTYFCQASRGHSGMPRKVKAASRQFWIKGEACQLRRFFITARAFLKCPQRHDDPYIIVTPAIRQILGRVEWCRVNL
ncbi:hypothetical protein ACFLTP_02610 [Chloroflexota bacterium]